MSYISLECIVCVGNFGVEYGDIAHLDILCSFEALFSST
jgi:hypothetical protein